MESMENKKKIDLANELKEQANTYYKSENYTEAIRTYHHALLQVKGVTFKSSSLPFFGKSRSSIQNTNGGEGNPEPSAIQQEAKSIKLRLHNNLAACLIKQRKWERTVHHCTEVLALEPNNCKALHRRGLAYLEMKNADKAENDLNHVAKIKPNDVIIRANLLALKELKARNKEAEKRMCSAMFSNKE